MDEITVELRDAYDTIAEDWHEDHRDDRWWVEGTERFAAMLPLGARILDVGCGGGTKSRWLSERGFRVTGVDISERLIAIARGEAPRAEFLTADMRDLPTDIGAFDAVFAQASLLHVPHARALKTLEHWSDRVRRHGGLLYLAVKERRPGQAREERKTEVDYGYEYTRFFSYWTLEELRYEVMLAGFVTMWENASVSGRTTWLQVVAKMH